MAFNTREFSSDYGQIGTYDSQSGAPGLYTAQATLACDNGLYAFYLAVHGATDAIVQSKSFATPNAPISDQSMTFTADNTAHNTLIITCGFAASFPLATATCTDTQGNVYTQLQFGHIGGQGIFMGNWICNDCAGGPNTVTVTWSGFGVPGGAIVMAISEYPGISTLDAMTQASGTLGPVYDLAMTTTDPDDLLYLMILIIAACGHPIPVTGGGGGGPTGGGKFVGTFVGILNPGTIGGGTR